MNPNWFGTFCAAGALAAFFFSYRRAGKEAKGTRIILTLGALVLAVPGASFAGYYAHLVRELSWYYEFRSWSGTELLLIFPGVAGGLVATLLPRRLLIIPLFGAAIFIITPVLKPFVGPIPAGTLRDTWDGEICMQSTSSTCGAASVATILRSFGHVATESGLAHDAHSYAGGTEAWYLARAVRMRGYGARFHVSSSFDPEIPLPALAGVRLDKAGHFIAMLSRDGDRFRIGDPLNGEEVLSRSELLGRYTFTGFYMSITNGEPKPHLQ